MFMLMIDRFEDRLNTRVFVFSLRNPNKWFSAKNGATDKDNTGRNEFSSKCDQFLESDHVYHAYIGHVTLGYIVRIYIRL